MLRCPVLVYRVPFPNRDKVRKLCKSHVPWSRELRTTLGENHLGYILPEAVCVLDELVAVGRYEANKWMPNGDDLEIVLQSVFQLLRWLPDGKAGQWSRRVVRLVLYSCWEIDGWFGFPFLERLHKLSPVPRATLDHKENAKTIYYKMMNEQNGYRYKNCDIMAHTQLKKLRRDVKYWIMQYYYVQSCTQWYTS